MPPLNDSESALSKIEDLSLDTLSETIARLEGLTDPEHYYPTLWGRMIFQSPQTSA